MKRIFLAFAFGLITLISFAGCSTTTIIESQSTTTQTGFQLQTTPPFSSTTTQTSSALVNTIATVQNMSVADFITGAGYVLDVSIVPGSLAVADTQYTVYLYDKGTYRDSTTLSWNQTELNINYKIDVTFPISETEYEIYNGQDLTGIFSVTISPTTPVTSPTWYTTPNINIISPQAYDDWYVGESVTIRWATSNIPLSTKFNVYLVTGKKYLIGTTLNTGSFNWVVTDQVLGSGISLALEIPGGSNYGSNTIPIEISSTPLPNTITVNGPVFMNITSPKNGAAWKVGDTITITWTSTNLPSYAYIGINLRSSTGQGYNIGNTLNTGSFTWVVTNQVIGTKIQIELNWLGAGSLNGVFVSISN